MKRRQIPPHDVYIVGSLLAAMLASLGIVAESPLLYGTVPGVIGGSMAVVATWRFLKRNEDLAGIVSTTCGFLFYQAFQANPITQPNFTAAISRIAEIDRIVGIFLGNFTTGMLLLVFKISRLILRRQIRAVVPRVSAPATKETDRMMLLGFWMVFAVVALPHVLFGQVVVGAFRSVFYQRAAWSSPGEFSGFDVWGGAFGAGLMNTTLWATSLIFFWVYLLHSRYRTWMLLLAPLVLIWTASAAFQGSRTYLFTIAFGMVVFFFGRRRLGRRTLMYAAVGVPLMLVMMQIATLYRTVGLGAVDLGEVRHRIFEIRGNEGTMSQMDGLEYFRTELLAKDAAPNPLSGFVRGLIERPIEGLLMPVPRALFPWKPLDESAREYNLFFQRVRLGSNASEVFLGASPGLMGRELIRYGILGPITVMFWFGAVLALADRLYRTASTSNFHRIFAAVLTAFLVAQMRDWVPMWVLPFLPAILIMGLVARKMRRMDQKKRRRMAESNAAYSAGAYSGTVA